MFQELNNTHLQNTIALIQHSLGIQWVQGIRKFLIVVVNLLQPRTTKLNTIHILQCISHLVQPIILGSSQFALSSTPQHRKEIPFTQNSLLFNQHNGDDAPQDYERQSRPHPQVRRLKEKVILM